MKEAWLPILLASGICVFAFPPDALPQVHEPSAPQLQRVPVSGLHIGTPGKLRNPYAGDANAWVQGRRLFSAMNCSGCHAPGGGGGMGPPLSDNQWIYGGDPGDVYLSILHGRPNGMPQWGTTLPPQAIWELVTYVESLSQPNPEYEPRTKLAVRPGPGNGPHPAAKKEPPGLPPRSSRPHPAPAATSWKR